jgi:hypothetical protein
MAGRPVRTRSTHWGLRARSLSGGLQRVAQSLQAAGRVLLITSWLQREAAVTLNVMRTWRMRRMRVAIIARSRPARIAGWSLAAVLTLTAAAVYGVALWRAPGWMHATTAQDRYNARVLVISVGGAIVVGTGLLYTARNYRLSRRGQVTDRYTIALERLGSSELYVRIGGVHALEHVMRDSADHHDDVIEVLTQFIRNRAPRRGGQADRQMWMHPVTGSVPDLPSKPTPDIQAALTVLGHRPHRPERQRIDLTGLHLTGARLDGANLTGAWLDGADLSGAWLVGADLSGAQLTRVNLTGVMLGRADLTGAMLDRADLTRAMLDRTNLTRAMLGANPSVVPPGWVITAMGELKPSPREDFRGDE